MLEERLGTTGSDLISGKTRRSTVNPSANFHKVTGSDSRELALCFLVFNPSGRSSLFHQMLATKDGSAVETIGFETPADQRLYQLASSASLALKLVAKGFYRILRVSSVPNRASHLPSLLYPAQPLSSPTASSLVLAGECSFTCSHRRFRFTWLWIGRTRLGLWKMGPYVTWPIKLEKRCYRRKVAVGFWPFLGGPLPLMRLTRSEYNYSLTSYFSGQSRHVSSKRRGLVLKLMLASPQDLVELHLLTRPSIVLNFLLVDPTFILKEHIGTIGRGLLLLPMLFSMRVSIIMKPYFEPSSLMESLLFHPSSFMERTVFTLFGHRLPAPKLCKSPTILAVVLLCVERLDPSRTKGLEPASTSTSSSIVTTTILSSLVDESSTNREVFCSKLLPSVWSISSMKLLSNLCGYPLVLLRNAPSIYVLNFGILESLVNFPPSGLRH